jgi:hypothetical protein
MSTPSVSTRRPRVGVLRTGLILAGLLGVLDIAGGIMQLGGGDVLPTAVAVLMIASGVATLVLVPFAWRGSAWAGWTIVGVRILSAMTGLPAFFVPGVPAGAVVAASTGLLLAVMVATLIALGMESRR